MIINQNNIYSYIFPKDAFDVADKIKKSGRMSSAIIRGFRKEIVICETKSHPRPYWRDIYINERYKLVAKRAAFNSLDFIPDFLCPTIFEKDCNGRDFQIQPLCEIKPKTEILNIKQEFKRLAPNLDCNGGNIGFLNGMAALIDW